MFHPFRTTKLRWLALLVAACLAASGCQPAPTATPNPAATPTTATPAASGPAGTARPTGAPLAEIPLARAVRDAVDPDAILANLRQLQSITDDHGGARPAGSEAHEAAAGYVADELRAAGYEVELQQVDVPFFRQSGPSTLEIVGAGARSFDDLHDFKAMLFSASGNVTAPIYALGFNPAAQPGDVGGLGCDAQDWSDVPAGVIVLLQPGRCRRHDTVVQAQVAGALGLVTAYPAWTRDAVLRPTLIEPADIRIPVLGTTQAVGQALAEAVTAGASVHIAVQAASETRSSINVVGETPWGDPDHVVMVGGHLDSVIDGPGSNDDGSGTMTVLEIARGLAAATGMSSGAGAGSGSAPPAAGWKVRVAFWTAEEIGLLGSLAWVGRSGAPSLDTIAVYLNLDMLGSPNGGRYVYDAASTTRPAESGVVSHLFAQVLEADGLHWQSISVGSSDNVPFDQFGVPTSGLFSGANEIKSAAGAALFGGIADTPEDACFHLACDTVDNLDPKLLGELADAAAWVVGALASGEVQLSTE